MKDPIVIVGGFASSWRDYKSGAEALSRVSGRRVFITNIHRWTWTLASITSYTLALELTHRAVQHAMRETGADKVMLVGHSAGGVISRAYLADHLDGLETRRGFKRLLKAYAGHQHVTRLITLGSPLRGVPDQVKVHRGLQHILWVDQTYPGEYYPHVQYLNVTGRAFLGNKDGTTGEKIAHRYYSFLSGNGEQWGDGVVPCALSHIDGVGTLEIEGMGHSPNGWWYFYDEAAIRLWWHYFEVGDLVSPDHQAVA